MFTLSVSYIVTSGRDYKQSEKILEVKVRSLENPKEFFLVIKKLMGLQCDDHCTSQYYMVILCPAYTVRDMSGRVPDIYYHKFSDKFMEEVNRLRDSRFTITQISTC